MRFLDNDYYNFDSLDDISELDAVLDNFYFTKQISRKKKLKKKK